MQHEPSQWGHPRFPHLIRKTTNDTPNTTHSQSPIVTGTSVLAVTYANGIMMAADCLASYGSLARFRDANRLNRLTAHCLIGTSGDIADQQHLVEELQREADREAFRGDGNGMGPRQWFRLLQAVQYQRRCKMDPLWTANIIGGVDPKTGAKFLGFVDLKGTNYEADTVATGFGAHLAQPLLRDAQDKVAREGRELTESEAVELLERCLRVLYCRDARAMDKVQLAKVTVDGAVIGAPYKIGTDWSIALSV